MEDNGGLAGSDRVAEVGDGDGQVGPFMPSSNILFYVGTFIGERLLYMPSVGYCLLLSYALCCLAGPWEQPSPADRPGAASPARRRPEAGLGAGRRWLSLLLACTLLAAYGGRTWLRNLDWADEESLFLSAQRVRPPSLPLPLFPPFPSP